MAARAFELNTRRFVLRPIVDENATALHELWSSRGVRRFLWDDQIIPFEQTQAAIRQNQALFDQHKAGLWGAWPPDATTLIGFVGLWPFRETTVLELVYGVAEDSWGTGCAAEIAAAVMEYCFSSLRMTVIRASTDVPNVRSIRVLEKLGFAPVSRSQVAGLDTVFFERAASTKRLEIVPYNTRWPDEFDSEARRLGGVLGGLAIRIDHNGSTSIPGLAAKPIIDIQISVATLHPLAPYVERLRDLGYVHVPHADDAFCPFFHRPATWPHTFHVHLVESGGVEERRTLAFRDYLRDHQDTAREYEHLKQRLASDLSAADAQAREAYAQGKSGFIERIVATALKDGYPRER